MIVRQHHTTSFSDRWWSLGLISASIVWTVGSLLIPGLLGVAPSLPPNHHVVLWPHLPLSICTGITGLILVAIYGLPLGSCDQGASGLARFVRILSPLGLLPLVLLGFFVRPFLPAAFPGNILFFLPLGLIACVLFRWSQTWTSSDTTVTSRLSLWVGLGIGLFYTLIGLYFTASLGPHAHDEGHYIIQAESLFHDHDLDLRNNLGWADETQRHYLNISPLSRNGHWYSWHSFGLPLLLAPFVPGGVPARHLILGLLCGLCCAGILELCRLFRARRHWALLVVLLFSGSILWGVYSSRCLPEVAGAAAATWSVVAILNQRARPWGSAGLLLVAGSSLPWLHTRFIPISLAVAGLYGLFALSETEPLKHKLGRLGLLGVLYLAALGVFFAVQWSMFEGGMPADVGKKFFAYPLGMWHVLASDRGLLSVLPFFAWMAGATLYTLTEKEFRQSTLVVMALFFIVLITSCATTFFDGGNTLPGRFLVVVLPLMISCTARAMDRVDTPARWWLIFLGLISCALFFLELLRLPDFKKYFGYPYESVIVVYPLLKGLIKPFTSPIDSVLHPSAIFLLIGTVALLFLSSLPTLASHRLTIRRVLAWGIVAAMLGVVILPWLSENRHGLTASDRMGNALRLEAMGPRLEKAYVQTWGARKKEDLFQISDRFCRLKIPSVTAEDLGVPYRGRWISQPRLEVNDWAGRGYRWAIIVRPFSVSRGEFACRIRGLEKNGITAYWAIREGTETRIEEPLPQDRTGAFEAVARTRYKGSGNVQIMVRIDKSEETLQDMTVSWTPVSEGLLKGALLSLPGG